MSRSLFDPTGPNTEHSGNAFLGPEAADHSKAADELGARPEQEATEESEDSASVLNDIANEVERAAPPHSPA